MSTIRRLTLTALSWADDEGATAVEYGLMLSMIVILAMAAMFSFSGSFGDMVDWIQTSVNNAV